MPRTRRAVQTNARKSIGSINVRELIEALEWEDPEALVVFASDYGDVGHTQQVHSIIGDIEEVKLEKSAYSRSGWAIRRERADEEDDGESGEETVPFLLIR